MTIAISDNGLFFPQYLQLKIISFVFTADGLDFVSSFRFVIEQSFLLPGKYYRPLFRGFDPALAVGGRGLPVVGDIKTRAFENNGCRRKNPLRFAAAFRAWNGFSVAEISFQLEPVSTTGTFKFVNGQGLRPPK